MDTSSLECGHLLCSGSVAARNDRSGVSHSTTWGGGLPGDKANNWFGEGILDISCCFLLCCSTDFPDHHDCFRFFVFLEQLKAVDEICPVYRVAADAHARRLPQPDVGELVHGFIGEGSASGDYTNAAFFVDWAGHDAYFAFSGRDHAGAVWSDEAC